MCNLVNQIAEIYRKYLDLLNNGDFTQLRDLLKQIPDINTFYEKKIDNKRKKGAFYTKKELAVYISNRTVEWFLKKFFNKLGVSENDNSYPFHILKKISSNHAQELFERLKTLTVLDPACGSGIFLLSIADLIFKIMREACNKQKIASQDWELKKEILENVIHGIDIDKTAICICELSLFSWFFESVPEEVLQSLDKEALMVSFSITNRDFLLEREFNKPFDIILGNPPYGNILNSEYKERIRKEIFFTNDIYCAFLIQSLKISDGIIGFLLPKSFLLRQNYLDLRNYLLEYSVFYQITDLGSKIFKGATNEVQIFLYGKKGAIKATNGINTKISDFSNNLINAFSNHNFDQLKICDKNIDCEMYDKQRRFFAYTFDEKCPFCGHQTRNINRIRIKLDADKIKIINYIERNSNLNFLNVQDFDMIRGEEETPLKELRKIIQKKSELISKDDYYLLNAKNDIDYFKIRKNKVVNLSGFSTKKQIHYYNSPKLLIKHNSIYPVSVFVRDNAIFTSSVYSLLGKEALLKSLSLLYNSKLMKFYCIYAINNQNDTTINLNQYMIRHLPLVLPEDLESTSVLYDIISFLIEIENNTVEFFKHFTDAIIYQEYFEDSKSYPSILKIFKSILIDSNFTHFDIESILNLKKAIKKHNQIISAEKKIFINPWVKEINKV